jgi:hypothetical protein
MNVKEKTKPKGHKGAGACKRSVLIRDGKASRYMPLFSTEDACSRAGIW